MMAQNTLTGALVLREETTGESIPLGRINGEGLLVDISGNPLNFEPGDYTLTIIAEGHMPYLLSFTAPAIPEGLPEIPIEKTATLVPLVAPSVTTEETPFFGKNIWENILSVFLLFIIALFFFIVLTIRRRREKNRAEAPIPPEKQKIDRKEIREEKRKTPKAFLKPSRFIGKKIGKYHITRLVDKGGMAYILEGETERGGKKRRVALKVPYENYQEDREFIRRFDQEARLGDVLFHENIINIIEYGAAEGGMRFIAMEYIDGTDLRGILNREKRLTPKMAAEITSNILNALDYAHSQSPPVYHRDIKPENILFRDKKGQSGAILTDFGIASHGGSLGTGKAVIGTSHYLCPDMSRGYPVSAGYDIYSLGIVFYEMLTGRVPFTGGDVYTIMRKHETESPRPIREINKAAPHELEAIVFKMLEKDPKKRFRTAKEVLKALRSFLNN